MLLAEPRGFNVGARERDEVSGRRQAVQRVGDLWIGVECRDGPRRRRVAVRRVDLGDEMRV